MATITSPGLEQLDRRGDKFAGQVTTEIHELLTGLAKEFSRTSTIDDLTQIPTLWHGRVDQLMAAVAETWLGAADNVYQQVMEASTKAGQALTAAVLTVPQVANTEAELYLSEAGNRLRHVSDIVWEVTRSTLLEGFQAGESIEQLRNRIVDATTLAEPRAGVIARTEIVSASNAGSFTQMKATGLPTVKEWVSTGGSRTRRSHARADGQRVPLDEPFMVGNHALKFPGDSSGPPEEVINCRCTVIYDIADENLADLAFEQKREDNGRWGGSDGKGKKKETDKEKEAPKSISGKSIKSTADGKKFIDDNFKDWEDKLSSSEYSARSFYQSPGFALMNGQLRSLDKSKIKADVSFNDADLARAKKASTNLKKAINKAPPLNEKLIAHRGFSADQFGTLKPGMRIQDKGFTSMSLTPDVEAVGKASSKAVARIELPTGAKVGAGRTRELIANAGSKFDVVSVSEKNGVTHVDLRLVV